MGRNESRPGTISPINLVTKQTGAPSAGNPHAGCDVAGAGNGFTVWLLRHSQRKRGATARLNLRNTAPVLDPTSSRPYSLPARFASRSQPVCRLPVTDAELRCCPGARPGIRRGGARTHGRNKFAGVRHDFRSPSADSGSNPMVAKYVASLGAGARVVPTKRSVWGGRLTT